MHTQPPSHAHAYIHAHCHQPNPYPQPASPNLHSDIWSCESQAFAELLESQQQPDSFGPRPPSAKAPSRAALARGDYQLIRMELCRHGDLEAYLR